AGRGSPWTARRRVTVATPGDQERVGGDAVSLAVPASDAGGGTLSYSATGLPPGLGINSSTGVISGTLSITADTGSPYTVTVTAASGGSSASQTFRWTVLPLTLTNPGPQGGVSRAAASLALQARRAGGGALTYSATNLPPGLSINSTTGVISGTLSPTAHTGSPYWVRVTAGDGTHSANQGFLWTVTQVGLSNPGDQTTQEGQAVSLQVTASGAGGP